MNVDEITKQVNAVQMKVDSLVAKPEDNKLTVLLVPVGKTPRVVRIDDELEAMQDLVGGYIEEYMPFEDEVALVCNEEGKMHGLDLNRAIYSENGEIMDIIAGDFFVCYAPIESENFQSLPNDLMAKYEKKFKYPEQFFRSEEGIKAVRFTPEVNEREADYER